MAERFSLREKLPLLLLFLLIYNRKGWQHWWCSCGPPDIVITCNSEGLLCYTLVTVVARPFGLRKKMKNYGGDNNYEKSWQSGLSGTFEATAYPDVCRNVWKVAFRLAGVCVSAHGGVLYRSG